MGGGGKGGSQSTSVQIPAWLETAAKSNLQRADELSKIGYTPYYGPDVAALTPMQEAAMRNTNAGALAFGLDAPTGTGMPAPQTFAGGVQGYSSGGLYDQALQELKLRMPGQYDALRAPFIDPVTGAPPQLSFSPLVAPPAQGFRGVSVDDRTGRRSSERNENDMWAGGGGGGSGMLSSRLPGGVNTRNPGSAINQAVARATSGSTRTPTSSNRPKANPKR